MKTLEVHYYDSYISMEVGPSALDRDEILFIELGALDYVNHNTGEQYATPFVRVQDKNNYFRLLKTILRKIY